MYVNGEMLSGSNEEVAKNNCSMNSLGDFEAILAALRQSDWDWLDWSGEDSRMAFFRSFRICWNFLTCVLQPR